MGELAQRIVLIHELGQLGGSEEFLDRGGHRLHVDERLRRDRIRILGLHPLADDALQSGEADPELVLKQLTDRSDSAVAQMIDIVVASDAVLEMNIVINGGEDVLLRDMLRDEVVDPAPQGHGQLVLREVLIQNLLQHGKIDQLRDADLLLLLLRHLNPAVDIHHKRGQHPDGMIHALHGQIDKGNGRVLDLVRELRRDGCPGLGQNLARDLVDNVLGESESPDPVPQHEFLIIFVASDLGQIIAPRVKEQVVHLLNRGIHGQRLARTDLFVQLKKPFRVVGGGIFGKAAVNLGFLAEEIDDLLVGSHAERADENRNRNLSCSVHADIEHVIGVRLVLEPGAPVGNHRAGVELLSDLVVSDRVVDAGRADQLAHDDALRAVYDKCAGLGHEGEVAHILLMLLDLSVLLIVKADRYLKRCFVVGIAFLAFLDRILRLVPAEPEVDELETQLVRIVLNRGNVVKYLPESIGDKPVVGVLLNLDEIRNLKNLLLSLVRHAHRPPGSYRTNSVFLHSTFHPVIS